MYSFIEIIDRDLDLAFKLNPKHLSLYSLILEDNTVLKIKNYKEEENVLPEEIENLVKQRIIARQEKNWAESDRLRDELINLGYSVKDTKDGIEVKKV